MASGRVWGMRLNPTAARERRSFDSNLDARPPIVCPVLGTPVTASSLRNISSIRSQSRIIYWLISSFWPIRTLRTAPWGQLQMAWILGQSQASMATRWDPWPQARASPLPQTSPVVTETWQQVGHTRKLWILRTVSRLCLAFSSLPISHYTHSLHRIFPQHGQLPDFQLLSSSFLLLSQDTSAITGFSPLLLVLGWARS